MEGELTSPREAYKSLMTLEGGSGVSEYCVDCKRGGGVSDASGRYIYRGL